MKLKSPIPAKDAAFLVVMGTIVLSEWCGLDEALAEVRLQRARGRDVKLFVEVAEEK